MTTRNLLVLIFLFIQSTYGKGQEMYTVRSNEDGTPIEHAIVQLFTQDSLRSEQLITDIEGHFVPAKENSAYVVVSHLAFETIKHQLGSSNDILLNPKPYTLSDIVVTGQFAPQSMRQSVYNVSVIDSKRIEAQGAMQLQEVLANQLNIRLGRDNATGRSGLSMQGLSGQYIKVLIDGIPINGRGGVFNDIDLAQIDLQNVDRVEVIEGPMSVNYGSDALAGVINIITKSGTNSKIDVKFGLQEETVGNEYAIGTKGIHNQNISIGFAPTSKWYTDANARYFRFGGWKGDLEGRQHAWYPKDQKLAGFSTRYGNNEANIRYRVSYVDEQLLNLGARVEPELQEPFAIDEDFNTQIWRHFLQGEWTKENFRYDGSLSYNRFDQHAKQVTKNLVTLNKTLTRDEEQEEIFYDTWFTRQTMSSTIWQNKVGWLFGLDGKVETAGGTKLNEGNKEQTEVGVFSSIEISLAKLIIRPGIRLTNNSSFKTSPTWSVNTKYDVSDKLQVRGAYGRGFRAPSLRELYHEFVDSNHNIIGNPDLKPEYSNNINVKLSYTVSALSSSFGVASFYNHVDEMITFFRFENAVNGETSYLNQAIYKTQGINLTQDFEHKNTSFNLGYSYIGRFQSISESRNVDEFVYSSEVTARVSQELERLGNLSISAFYKYNGAVKQYRTNQEDEVVLVGLDGFHLLDVSMSKTFFKTVSVSLGAKNLLNVTNVNGSSANGAHGGDGGSLIAYGRSYFFKINYHFFKINK